MSTVALNPAPFTELRLTISNKKDKTYMTDIASYLMNEVFKNEELPYLPREMWDYILTFIPNKFRSDAFVILNLVHRYTCMDWRGQYSISICSVADYINEYGKDQFETIKTLSFNSLRNDLIMAKSIRCTELQQVLNMDDATKTELIKILDNTTSKSPINLQIALINIPSN